MKIAITGLACLVGVLLLVFVLNVFDFSQYVIFQPRVTAVQNKTFHESQQYTDGKLNALRAYKVQYDTASTDTARASIRSMVVDEFASYDNRNLNGHPNLQAFLEQMESGQ